MIVKDSQNMTEAATPDIGVEAASRDIWELLEMANTTICKIDVKYNVN